MAVSCPAGSHGRQVFRIYVLEFCDTDELYVGVTAKSVTERIKEHQTGGGKRSGRAHRVCRWRKDLSPPAQCLTRERAEEIEARTAARLRALGYSVRSG